MILKNQKGSDSIADIEILNQGRDYLIRNGIIDAHDNNWLSFQKIYTWCKKFEPNILNGISRDFSNDNLYKLYEQISIQIVNKKMLEIINNSRNSKITCIYLDSPIKSLLADKTFIVNDKTYHVKKSSYTLRDVRGIEINNTDYYDIDDFYAYLVYALGGRIIGKVSCIISVKRKRNETDTNYKIEWNNLKEAINSKIDFPIEYMKKWNGKTKTIKVLSEELENGKRVKGKVEVPEYIDKLRKIIDFKKL